MGTNSDDFLPPNIIKSYGEIQDAYDGIDWAYKNISGPMIALNMDALDIHKLTDKERAKNLNDLITWTRNLAKRAGELETLAAAEYKKTTQKGGTQNG